MQTTANCPTTASTPATRVAGRASAEAPRAWVCAADARSIEWSGYWGRSQASPGYRMQYLSDPAVSTNSELRHASRAMQIPE
jgi:hypothetical protein